MKFQVVTQQLLLRSNEAGRSEELVVTNGMGQYSEGWWLGVLGFGEIGRASGAGGGKRRGGRPMLAWVSGNKAFL